MTTFVSFLLLYTKYEVYIFLRTKWRYLSPETMALRDIDTHTQDTSTVHKDITVLLAFKDKDRALNTYKRTPR